MEESSDAGDLPMPGAAAGLYEISTASWQAISQRVSAVIAAQQIAAEVAQSIPNYPALLATCTMWRGQTFVAIISQAVLVEMFAKGVSKQFSLIQSALAGLADDAPVPADSVFMDRLQFQALADQAGQFAADAATQAPQVAQFVAENETADATLAQIAASLPSDWAPIAGSLTTLGTAFPALGSAWTETATQLHTLADRNVVLTTVGALCSDLTTTIAAWDHLGTVAQAFSKQAEA